MAISYLKSRKLQGQITHRLTGRLCHKLAIHPWSTTL